MENQEFAPDENQVRIPGGLSLSDLITKGETTFEVNFDDVIGDEEQFAYDTKNVYEHANPECLGLIDEDTYQDGEPFENLEKKMVNILEDGKIKKRVLREGYGSDLAEKSIVTIEFNAYLEYNDEPFDSTYLRRKPFTFRLGDGQTIPGLDYGVQTMKLNEKSQFLIRPEYAYGKLGCMPRIPANSTVLYEVEVKKTVDSGASIFYADLSEEQQKEFSEIYKYAHALCSKGKDLYGKKLYKQAIKEYNIAASKLEACQLRDYKDQEEQQKLLHRLYTNLVIAHTKIQEPRRSCINYNKLNYMCKGTDLKMPVKVYFNHARSLMVLSDYDMAERQLRKAYNLEPQNKEITQEFIKLDAKRKESYAREVSLAKAIFRNTKDEKLQKQDEVGKEFEDSITQYCKDLLGDKENVQYNLPDKLTKNELKFTKKEAEKHGLEVKSFKSDDADVEKYFIAKSPDVA